MSDVFGALEQAAQRHAIRSALAGRRLVCAGALAGATAMVAVTIARRGRLRRVRPVVLS